MTASPGCSVTGSGSPVSALVSTTAVAGAYGLDRDQVPIAREGGGARHPAQQGRELGWPTAEAQSASTPDIALMPTSIACHVRPAWNGSPAAKRRGTDSPSIFFPTRHSGDVPTL
jgi:hypothetical protein